MPLKLLGLYLLAFLIVIGIMLFALTGVKAASFPVLRHNALHLIPPATTLGSGLEQGPVLQIVTGDSVTSGQMLTVLIHYQSNGFAIAATSFSLDLDQSCLALDLSDNNKDGRPDAIRFATPSGLNASAAVDLADEDGEIDIIIADYFPPFVTLPDLTPLLELQLTAVCQPAPGATQQAYVAFSSDPPPSFGSTTGGSITGTAIDGFVTIVGPALPPTATLTPPPLLPTEPAAMPTLVPTIPPVTIVESFVATPAANMVRLTWRTSSEADTAGFYLYRKQIEGEGTERDFQLISAVVPAQGVQGGSYLFVDQDVEETAAYLYLLVEEKDNGARTEFIQLLITIHLTDYKPYQYLLPLIIR